MGEKSIFANSFEKWAEQNRDRIFRYWVYRRMFTPYEISKEFSDESMFEDSLCTCGHIKEVIELPDKDILIGFLNTEATSCEMIDYYKLSEIRLGYCSSDELEGEDECS